MSYELDSVVMSRWSKTLAGVRGVEGREKEEELTVRPGACPDGMAGQCPRGRLDATEDDSTVAPPGAPQWRFHRRAHTHLDHFKHAQPAP
jgi:hypothetical protein